MSIDPQEFGKMVGAVENNSENIKELKEHIKEHKDEMRDLLKEGLGQIKQVIRDHMKEEEEDNDAQNARLEKLANAVHAIEKKMEEERWFWDKLEWVQKHPKTTWMIFALACTAGIVTFGYLFPELAAMLYKMTNGRVDLTSFLALYLDAESLKM